MGKMICVADLEYPPGRYLKPGDEFEAEENHVKMLETIGRARPAGYETRDMSAAGPKSYARRDMAAKPTARRQRGSGPGVIGEGGVPCATEESN